MSFRQCTSCAKLWQSQEEFLTDPEVSLLGLQVCFEDLMEGLIMFNHSCKTTFSVEVSQFENLYEGPVYEERATGSGQCPGYCLNEKDLTPCPAKCACAFVREILQKIKLFPKQRRR
jgi:hypothetical protein